VPDDGGTKNENPSLGLELLFGRLPPWKLPRIVIGMRERPTWIIMKKEEQEEEEVDEEDVVRHYHRAFTVVDILHPYYSRHSGADVDSDDYEHEHAHAQEHEHDHGAAAAPEGSYVPHIAAFESKAFAHWVRVAISADPSWKEARLRRVSLTRLVEACDGVHVPRVALFRTSFLRGITCHKL
jgi:hypothetical protein